MLFTESNGGNGRRLGIKIYALDRSPVGADEHIQQTPAAAAKDVDETLESSTLSGARLSQSSSASSAAGAVRLTRSFFSPPSSSLVAELQLAAPRRRRHTATWQTLLLPTTFVQDALDSVRTTPPILRLRIVCEGCEAAGRELVVDESPESTDNGDAAGDDNKRGQQQQQSRQSGSTRRQSGTRSQDRACVVAPPTNLSTAPYLIVEMKRRQVLHGHHRQRQQQQQQRRGQHGRAAGNR
jgi:hypothetical protein